MVVLQTANRCITGLVLAADRDALGFMLDSCFILTISALAVLITILSVRHLHVKLTFLKLSDPSVHLMGSLQTHIAHPCILDRSHSAEGYSANGVLGKHLVVTDIFKEPQQHKLVMTSVFTFYSIYFPPVLSSWSIIILVRSSCHSLYSTVFTNTGRPVFNTSTVFMYMVCLLH